MLSYTLGPLPWSEETLRRAHFHNFLNAYGAIKEHPGYAAHSDLESLTLSFDIFISLVSELFEAIEIFRINEKKPEF